MADTASTPIQIMQQCYEAANAAFEAAEVREMAVRDDNSKGAITEGAIAKNAQKAALNRATCLSDAICVEPPLSMNDVLTTLCHLYLIAEDLEANLAADDNHKDATKRLSQGMGLAIGKLSNETGEALTGWMRCLVKRSRAYLDASLAEFEEREAA